MGLTIVQWAHYNYNHNTEAAKKIKKEMHAIADEMKFTYNVTNIASPEHLWDCMVVHLVILYNITITIILI